MADGRLLSKGICKSEEIEKLTAFQETVFYRLIVNCDDYGRTDARPLILKADLFPLKDVSIEELENAIHALVTVGLVTYYKVDGRPYLEMKTWAKHQRIRNVRSKYPPPPEDCGDLQQIAADCSDLPPSRARAESESNKNPNPNRNRKFVPPTLEDVKAYVLEKGYHVDAEYFFKYYDEGNWIDSKGNPVKNWKQKLLTWESKDKQKPARNAPASCKPIPAQDPAKIMEMVGRI